MLGLAELRKQTSPRDLSDGCCFSVTAGGPSKCYGWLSCAQRKGLNMKKFVVAAILTAFSLPALAADLRVPPPAYKAPLAVPLLDPWTGWYVGAHIGYGWNSENNAAAFEFIPIGTLVNTPQGVLGD